MKNQQQIWCPSSWHNFNKHVQLIQQQATNDHTFLKRGFTNSNGALHHQK
jgi:hypothetical protein